MLKRFKDWLYRKYLPAYAKEGVWADNKRLLIAIDELEKKREIDVAKAYSSGMAYALKHMKISISNEVKS